MSSTGSCRVVMEALPTSSSRRVAGEALGGGVHGLDDAVVSVSMMLKGAVSKTELLKSERLR